MLCHVLTSFVCEQRKMSKTLLPNTVMNCIYQQHFNSARLKHLCPSEIVAYSTIHFNRINMQLRPKKWENGRWPADTHTK